MLDDPKKLFGPEDAVTCSCEQLTREGEKQTEKVGVFLRNRYSNF
jgi:hypothetical protein